MGKVGKDKYGTPATTYKGLKNELFSNNHVLIKFWFCGDEII